MRSAPFPNRLRSDDLVQAILKHMVDNIEFRLSQVIRMVTSNIPNSATATYHLFHKRLQKHLAAERSLKSGKDSHLVLDVGSDVRRLRLDEDPPTNVHVYFYYCILLHFCIYMAHVFVHTYWNYTCTFGCFIIACLHLYGELSYAHIHTENIHACLPVWNKPCVICL